MNAAEMLEHLKKYHFWYLSLILLLTAVGAWYLGTGAIASDAKKWTGEIDTAFTSVSSASNSYLPNTTYVEQTNKLVEMESQAVLDSWQALHDHQQQVLTWPAGLAEFEELLTSGEYLELGEQNPAEATRLRAAYKDVVIEAMERRLTTALNLLDYDEPAVREMLREMEEEQRRNGLRSGVPGGEFPGGGPGSERGELFGGPTQRGGPEQPKLKYPTKGLIYWGGMESLFRRYPFLYRNRPPSMIQIKYLQEDLWTYEVLFRLLSGVNEEQGDVTDPTKAPIKAIRLLEIGQSVQPPPNLINAEIGAASESSEAAAGPGMEGGAMPGMEGPGAMPGEGSSEGGSESGSQDEESALTKNRYVDLKGKPLPASGGGAADASGIPAAGGDEGGASGSKPFKLMPFRMVLLMDQGYLSKLLAAAGNFPKSTPLPIRILQLQVLPHSEMPLAGSRTGAAGYGGEMSPEGPGGYMPGGEGEGFPGGFPESPEEGPLSLFPDGESEGAGGENSSGSLNLPRSQLAPQGEPGRDVSVELRGYIYFYVEPSLDAFATLKAKVEAEQMAAGDGTPAQPGDSDEVGPDGQPLDPTAPGTEPEEPTGPTEPLTLEELDALDNQDRDEEDSDEAAEPPANPTPTTPEPAAPEQPSPSEPPAPAPE